METGTTKICDFSRSYMRFHLDFDRRPPSTLSHEPPTRENHVRVLLESICRIRHHKEDNEQTYVLTASCKSEQVGADDTLWLLPNADVCFIAGDGRLAVLKSWHKNHAGVMLEPPSLGPQPERQVMVANEVFESLTVEVEEADGTILADFDEIADGILGSQRLVSRIEYTDGDYEICIDQPIKTINVSPRDQIFQTDTGPILLPNLTPERWAKADHLVDTFDLAYSAFKGQSWAEFIVQEPTPVAEGVTVNHYARPRRIDDTRNAVIAIH